jgi:hypothetical protein
MPPSIVVATITCRPDPEARLPDMARTLAYAADALRGRASLTWLVIDELDRDLGDLPPTGALVVRQTPARPSELRQRGLPDHNKARNSAIVCAHLLHADYVVFLDDQTVVTRSFGDVVLAAAARDAGYRAVIKFLRDAVVPPSGEIDAHEAGGLDFVTCAATSVAGGCFGAPLKALLGVDGFDEAYSGQYGREDVECFVRLERAGLKWQTCKRAAALQLGTGAPGGAADRARITTDRDALQGKRNKVLFKKLLADRTRTAPEIGLSKSTGDYAAHVELELVRAEGTLKELVEMVSNTPQAVKVLPAQGVLVDPRHVLEIHEGDSVFVGTQNDVVGASIDTSKLVVTISGPAEALLPTVTPDPDAPAVDLDDLLDV